MKRIIVKMQISLFTNSPDGQQTLVYDKARKYEGQWATTELERTLMDGRIKAFFYAELKGSQVQITGEAPWQEW